MALIRMSALELPEIRHIIAHFLSMSELATAARVCKSWHKSFNPFLYQEVTLNPEVSYVKTVVPSAGSIEANAEHIRAAYFYSEPLDFPLEALTKLELIVLSCQVKSPEMWTRLATLLRLNPGLQQLTVNASGNEEHMHGFMEALASSCPKLHMLDASVNSLDGTCTRLLLDAAVRVKKLKLIALKLDPLDITFQWPVFANLEELALGFSSIQLAEQQLDIFRKIPLLKSLVWYINNCHDIPKFSEVIATHCSHLESLELWDLFNPRVDISSVLDSCQGLSRFLLGCIKFNTRAHQSLRRHYTHLTYLDLSRHCGAKSTMIQQVMTSCPRLDYLRAERLDACDILGVTKTYTSDAGKLDEDQQATNQAFRPQAWVCTSLRTLSLYICGLEGKAVEWHREVLRQLSRLTKLNTLAIGGWTQHSRDGLDLRLESGLGLLSDVKLRQLD
ncbi:hypothetical protein BGX31_010673, partial [Mortierella sp. GBA43]